MSDLLDLWTKEIDSIIIDCEDSNVEFESNNIIISTILEDFDNMEYREIYMIDNMDKADRETIIKILSEKCKNGLIKSFTIKEEESREVDQ